jgi:hypothetical protein
MKLWIPRQCSPQWGASRSATGGWTRRSYFQLPQCRSFTYGGEISSPTHHGLTCRDSGSCPRKLTNSEDLASGFLCRLRRLEKSVEVNQVIAGTPVGDSQFLYSIFDR